jgi:hypothetical protein
VPTVSTELETVRCVQKRPKRWNADFFNRLLITCPQFQLSLRQYCNPTFLGKWKADYLQVTSVSIDFVPTVSVELETVLRTEILGKIQS